MEVPNHAFQAVYFVDPFTCTSMLHKTIKGRQIPKKHNMTSLSKFLRTCTSSYINTYNQQYA